MLCFHFEARVGNVESLREGCITRQGTGLAFSVLCPNLMCLIFVVEVFGETSLQYLFHPVFPHVMPKHLATVTVASPKQLTSRQCRMVLEFYAPCQMVHSHLINSAVKDDLGPSGLRLGIPGCMAFPECC